VPPVAAMVALYAPPAVPLERVVVVMLRGVDWAGGLPEGGDFTVTVPHPASSIAAARRRTEFCFCIVAYPAPITDRASVADERLIGNREVDAAGVIRARLKDGCSSSHSFWICGSIQDEQLERPFQGILPHFARASDYVGVGVACRTSDCDFQDFHGSGVGERNRHAALPIGFADRAKVPASEDRAQLVAGVGEEW